MKINARSLFSLTKKSRFARIDNVFKTYAEVSERPHPKTNVVAFGDPTNNSTAQLREKHAEVSERPNVHAWKACVVKATSGSNPDLCAKKTRRKE